MGRRRNDRDPSLAWMLVFFLLVCPLLFFVVNRWQSISGIETVTFPAADTSMNTNTTTSQQSPVTNPNPVGTLAVTSAFTPPPGSLTLLSPQAVTVTRETTLLTCPRLFCAVIARLPAGTTLTVDGAMNGDILEGTNALWYRVNYYGSGAYIYSAAVVRGS